MVVRNMSKDLFKGTFKHGGTSRKISIRLENFFRNNKEARAIQLDHKFRTTEIGDLSIHAYYQELKSILDLLANVDAPITERTLVTYLLNGLNGKYDNIINVIMHRQPFPTFEEARSMLILEEDRLGKGKKTLSTNDASSSSAKVLIATVSNSDSKSGHQQQQPARFNQNRGNRGRCDNRGRGRHNYNQNRPQFNQWNTSVTLCGLLNNSIHGLNYLTYLSLNKVFLELVLNNIMERLAMLRTKNRSRQWISLRHSTH